MQRNGNHIDEHLLELYILKAPEVVDRKGEIEKHLEACDACRELAREMAAHYLSAVQDLVELESQSVPTVSALEPLAGKIVPFHEVFEAEIPHAATSLARFIWYVRRRPSVAVVGGLGIVAACILGLMTLASRMGDSTNPTSVLMNTNSSRIEVFNRDNKLLWELPYLRSPIWPADSVGVGTSAVEVADLDGDNTNEVIVSAVFPDMSNRQASILRVYKPDKSIIFERSFREQLHYGSFEYDQMYSTTYVLIPDRKKNGGRDLLVGCGGYRSPFGLVRIDKSNRVLGQYWHYGQLGAGYLTNIASVDGRAVLLTGSDDVADTIESERAHDPLIVVLDAEKILGLTESSSTRGFGFERSSAEVFCVKLPSSDMSTALHLRPAVQLISQSDSIFEFNVWAKAPGGGVYVAFDFGFNRNMEAIWVKSVDYDADAHRDLKKRGLIKSVLNQQYLENLKRQIQYWDGSQWRNEWCRVQNP